MTFSRDEFLGGKVVVRQPVAGYRAGADPVFLAAAVAAKPGERVLELGCGSGVALLCLAARVPGLALTGVERNPEAAELARENFALNAGLDTGSREIVTADLAQLPDGVTATGFHHVIANPPFFDRNDGSKSVDAGREAGRGEETPLATWIDVAVRRLLPKGTLTLVHRAERLPQCLAALDGRMGGASVLPLVARAGRPAKSMILRAKKGSKTPFRIESPFVLHEGDHHEKDGDSYTTAAQAVLRKGEALPLGR